MKGAIPGSKVLLRLPQGPRDRGVHRRSVGRDQRHPFDHVIVDESGVQMTTKPRLWQVHGDGKHIPPTEVVAPDERLAWPQTIGLGIQHVFAMFGATFLVPVLIGFPPNTTLFFSGIGTMIFLLVTIGRGQRLGLPSYL